MIIRRREGRKTFLVRIPILINVVAVNPAHITYFLLTRSRSFVNGKSINKMLILGGKGHQVDF